LKAFEAAYGRLLDACAAVSAAVVLALTTLFTLTVILRVTAGSRVTGDVELSEYAMVLITAFAAPWLLRQGRHVRLDVVLVNLPPRLAWRCELVGDAMGLAVSLLLLWYGARVLVVSALAGTRIVKEFTIPEWWTLWPLPLMFALVAIEFAFRFRRVLHGPRRARAEGGQL
jgi:TRAP-type C4-dicarboxylate transport system permease small subunit